MVREVIIILNYAITWLALFIRTDTKRWGKFCRPSLPEQFRGRVRIHRSWFADIARIIPDAADPLLLPDSLSLDDWLFGAHLLGYGSSFDHLLWDIAKYPTNMWLGSWQDRRQWNLLSFSLIRLLTVDDSMASRTYKPGRFTIDHGARDWSW